MILCLIVCWQDNDPTERLGCRRGMSQHVVGTHGVAAAFAEAWKKTKKHQKPLLFTRVTHISFVCDFSLCFFVLCSINIPLRLSHLIADSITSSKLQACRQAVPLWCRSLYMFYVTFTCALCWGNWAVKEWAEKWHQLCWFGFFLCPFFAGINLVAAVPRLLSLCWGRCVKLILCYYFPNSPDICAISRLFEIGCNVNSGGEKTVAVQNITLK